MLLARLDWYCPIQIIAAVDLQILLVRPDIQLDARYIAGHGQHGDIRRFLSRVAWSVKDKGVVVAGAVEATLMGIRDVCANLLWACKVESSTIDDFNAAGGDLDTIYFDSPSRVRHVEGIVENGRCFGVDEGSEVPINMVCEHDGSRLVERN